MPILVFSYLAMVDGDGGFFGQNLFFSHFWNFTQLYTPIQMYSNERELKITYKFEITACGRLRSKVVEQKNWLKNGKFHHFFIKKHKKSDVFLEKSFWEKMELLSKFFVKE